MRLIGIVAALLLYSGAAAAQDRQRAERGHFGAPVVRLTTLRDQTAVMLGGRGGWNLTPSFVLGFGAYGTMSEVDAPAGVPFAPGPLDLKFESFGVEVEYSLRPAAPTHLTLSALAGGAAAHYMNRGTTEQHGETDFMLLLEPAMGVDRVITESVHLNLAVAYRAVAGVEQVGLRNGDVAGPAVSLAVKIGRP